MLHACWSSLTSLFPSHTTLQRITKAINRNVEMVSSARAQKAGDTFSMKDIKVSWLNWRSFLLDFPCLLDHYPSPYRSQATGKELNREIRREELTRKKSRVEEKLAELKAKMDDTSWARGGWGGEGWERKEFGSCLPSWRAGVCIFKGCVISKTFNSKHQEV